jgi:hypothetical protein
MKKKREIVKMDAVSTEIVDKWKELQEEAAELEQRMQARIGYILKFFFEAAGSKLDWWRFGSYEEEKPMYGQVGKDYISGIYAESKGSYPSEESLTFIDKNGKEELFLLDWGIPTRWLYEDFEQEVVDGLKKYKDVVAQRKAKEFERRTKNKQEKEKLVAEAKAKLTKEERKLLGIN